nr:hypothetical protein [Tanacetum cinerariifolium]
EIKSTKPKEKGIDIQERKDQIRFDEQTALKLQAAFDEEEILAREKAEKLVEGKEKRAGTELIQEITKKQKVEDDKETAELKQFMKIIPDEEEIEIDVIPLSVNQMLKSSDKEDLEDLYKLEKAKYESTRPVEDLDLLLWGDLKSMFEPHVEDEVWKMQQGYK